MNFNGFRVEQRLPFSHFRRKSCMKTLRKENIRDKPTITADFDKPIEKPFDELPVWFLEMLNSRFTTKRPYTNDGRGFTTNSRRHSHAA